jgi:hypothetical protein
MYQPGNLILIDHNDYREPPFIIMRSIVAKQEGEIVTLKSEKKVKVSRTAGLPITVELVLKYDFTQEGNVFSKDGFVMQFKGDHFIFEEPIQFGKIYFVHEMQNAYQEKTGKVLEIVPPVWNFGEPISLSQG